MGKWNNEAEWNFPPNNYGQYTGLNDSGIETFRGNLIESLARETIQNSLDAKNPEIDQAVKISFKHYNLANDKLPFDDDYKNVLKSCIEYWKDNDETKEFFSKALNLVDQDQISLLKVSDYNTIGLTGSDQDDEPGSNWYNLIRSVGSSDKPSGAGGSFGIGKHAPFACSNLRTVFYLTKDCEQKTALQGVAKLVTHENKDGEPTQGTGYYSIGQKNKPITDFEKIDEFFFRAEIGTDILIPAFNGGDDWKQRIIKSVLANFFVAIKRETLVVEVENTLINSDNLPELMEEYIKDDSDYAYADKYYKALLSSETHKFEINFAEISKVSGKLTLYVLTKKNYPKRVAMVRNTGMKIFDKGHFRTPLKFAGVMIAEGQELNQFLASLEPPSHDDWQPERHDNPKFADKVRNNLYDWVREKIYSISVKDDVEELDVDGMSQYLPDDLDDLSTSDNKKQDKKGDKEKDPAKKINIKKQKRKFTREVKSKGEETDSGQDNNLKDRDNKSSGEDNDLDGKEDDLNRDDSGGYQNSERGDKSVLKSTPLRLIKNRSFCINPNSGKYKVIVKANNNKKGFLAFKIVGEVNKDNLAIEEAFNNQTKEKISITPKGRVGPIKFKAKQMQNFTIKLREPIRCAMEVLVYENKA